MSYRSLSDSYDECIPISIIVTCIFSVPVLYSLIYKLYSVSIVLSMYMFINIVYWCNCRTSSWRRVLFISSNGILFAIWSIPNTSTPLHGAVVVLLCCGACVAVYRMIQSNNHTWIWEHALFCLFQCIGILIRISHYVDTFDVCTLH